MVNKLGQREQAGPALLVCSLPCPLEERTALTCLTLVNAVIKRVCQEQMPRKKEARGSLMSNAI